MSEIPEEIRKLFPNQPIHKLDIVDGKLVVLSSQEPISPEPDPDFDNMPTEKVDEYLRQHGYDPERVHLDGKILAGMLVENLDLRERAEKAEAELAALHERIRWKKFPGEKPKYGSRVLLILRNNYEIIATFYDSYWKNDQGTGVSLAEVVAWRPLELTSTEFDFENMSIE